MYSIFKTKFNAKFIYSTCQNKSFIIKDYESALFLELLNIYIAITLFQWDSFKSTFEDMECVFFPQILN